MKKIRDKINEVIPSNMFDKSIEVTHKKGANELKVSKTIHEKNPINEDFEKVQEEDEWVWVEGYKGTEANMTCRNQQYNIGELHRFDGEVVTGAEGFHLCVDLMQVFRFYPINFEHRFFRVQALVRKSEFERASKIESSLMLNFHPRNTILAARVIVFLNELEYHEIEEYVQSQYVFVENEQEYKNMKDYNQFVTEKALGKMKELGFSEAYSLVAIHDFENQRRLYSWLRRAESYVEESLSRDMLIYLLEQDKRRLINNSNYD